MHINIGRLAWELSVLQRAVTFSNLSAASRQIGISQPQLSRILKKIEDELGIHLLDRRVKRAPRWTQEAHKVSQAFREAVTQLEKKIRAIETKVQVIDTLSLATLEGLAGIGLKLAETFINKGWVKTVRHDVLDLKDLSLAFESGAYDLVITSQRGGRRKNNLEKRIGFQVLEKETSNRKPQFQLKSSFEAMFKSSGEESPLPIIISNSLAVRRLALEILPCQGIFPSKVYYNSRGHKSGEQEVVIVARERLTPPIMEFLSNYSAG